MKVLSLYCGAGGIDEGLKQAGIKTNLAIDWDQDCCETIKNNHESETLVSSVKDAAESLGKFDIVIGGPPCPEFSNAKMNRTHDSTEVDLFFDIVDKINPKYWLMENVPGVIKVCKRRNFLLNCANYGTPQTRIRRFYTNLPVPKESHSKTPSDDLFGNSVKPWVSVKKALGLQGIIEDRKTTFGEKYGTDKGKFREYPTERPSMTILADARPWFISPTGFANKNKKIVSRSINEPAQTIVVANQYRITDKPVYSTKYIKYKNEYKTARHLTIEEMAILQGFPTDYKFAGNKVSIKGQIGRAVPAQPIKAFFKQVIRNE